MRTKLRNFMKKFELVTECKSLDGCLAEEEEIWSLVEFPLPQPTWIGNDFHSPSGLAALVKTHHSDFSAFDYTLCWNAWGPPVSPVSVG